MIIRNIELNNFGSYEGVSELNFNDEDDKNIILIGGKNGAGKTTLFTAIRLCIYGYRAFGYQSLNSFYNRSIIKLINNNAKLQEPTTSHIKIGMLINNGQEYDEYTIQRSWIYEKNSIIENISILKNNINLSEEEIFDFEKYIMQIIPPDLFDLYFFDGERIADFFLEEGSKVRLKNAFLTLCGYDIFEIMNKNFKRMLSSSSINNDIVNQYIKLKDSIDETTKNLEELKDRLILNYKNIDEVDSKINTIDSVYKKNGGVSKGDWDKKFQQIKDEEKFREEQNALLKKIANDKLPFLILKKEIKNLSKQIEKEEDLSRIISLPETLKMDFVQDIFNSELGKTIDDKQIKSIENKIKKLYSDKNILLDLSNEQMGMLTYQINKIHSFDEKKIYEISKSIKDSIKKVQNIRSEIEKCNIDKIDDYVATKTQLLDDKTQMLHLSVKLGNEIQEKESEYAILNSDFIKSKKEYESELKKSSINDISSKAVIMLDKLLTELYCEQINKVIEQFKIEINKLMRKKDFISDIEIDSDFNIVVYRTNKYTVKEIKEIKESLGDNGIITTLGNRAFNMINQLDLSKNTNKTIDIDIELNKSSFSNGEKQIFIMALYKSLMSLCRYEVPFVIDTPFARIDSEHRNNISKYFFRELKGQVFILSTNEEVEDKHFSMLEDKLAATYMLDNSDNTKTIIQKDIYFSEV